MLKRETKICDECGSLFYAESSHMDALCAECASLLYGHENCAHTFSDGRCSKCGWDGAVSLYGMGLREKMGFLPAPVQVEVNAQITRFYDASFPGCVECVLRDAEGCDRLFRDKVSVFTAAPLNESTVYPQDGMLVCELIREWMDDRGRLCCLVNTWQPHGIESVDGKTQFSVLKDQVRRIPLDTSDTGREV